MSSTPPGWYPDPMGALRYWDGQAWVALHAPALRANELTAQQRFAAAVVPLLPQGETPIFVWTGVKGVGSSPLVMLALISQLLLVFQQFRVYAVTPYAIYVFKAGWFTRTKPNRLRARLPLNSPVQLTPNNRISIGGERVRVTAGRTVAQVAVAWLQSRRF